MDQGRVAGQVVGDGGKCIHGSGGWGEEDEEGQEDFCVVCVPGIKHPGSQLHPDH